MSAAAPRRRLVPLWFVVKNGLLGDSRFAPFSAQTFRNGKYRGRFPFLLNREGRVGKVSLCVDALRAWAADAGTHIWIDWIALEWAASNLHDLANYKPAKKEGV